MRRPQGNRSGAAPKPTTGEVLDASPAAPPGAAGDNYIALIAQYTERPDLLIDTLERHDPGFIKKMNERAAARADRMSSAKFWFGGVQAYAGLGVSILAAVTVLGLIAYAVYMGTATFSLVAGLTFFYAVSQGGPSGFVELCRGIADWVRGRSAK